MDSDPNAPPFVATEPMPTRAAPAATALCSSEAVTNCTAKDIRFITIDENSRKLAYNVVARSARDDVAQGIANRQHQRRLERLPGRMQRRLKGIVNKSSN